MHKVYHRVERITGSVIEIKAEGVAYRELAEVTSEYGSSLAQVIRLDGDNVSLQVFAGARGVSTDAKVRFLGRTMGVAFSDALLGRIFTGTGNPRDNGPSPRGLCVPAGCRRQREKKAGSSTRDSTGIMCRSGRKFIL